MNDLLTFAEVEHRLREQLRGRTPPRLIAIDGLPCAGKSTLAKQLAGALGFERLSMDDFVIPVAERAACTPAFPFPFFRMDALRAVVRALRAGQNAEFCPYDWASDRIVDAPRRVSGDRRWIVEGCSALEPELHALFDVRIFVESDPATLWDAHAARDGEADPLWRALYLPSVDLYMQTRPQDRADFRVAGRGADNVRGVTYNI